LLVPCGQKFVCVLNEERGSSAVPRAASRMRTSTERVDVPSVLSLLARLDGKSLCLRQKQRLKIAAICSIQRRALLSFKNPNHFRLKHTLHCEAVITQGLCQLHSVGVCRVIRSQYRQQVLSTTLRPLCRCRSCSRREKQYRWKYEAHHKTTLRNHLASFTTNHATLILPLHRVWDPS